MHHINFTDSWKNWCWLSERFWTQWEHDWTMWDWQKEPEAMWVAKQLEVPDFIFCFQELHPLKPSLVTLTLDYVWGLRPRKAPRFLACMLDMVMPHLHIWVSRRWVPTSFHLRSVEKHVLLPGPIPKNWRTGLATLWIHRSLWQQP